MLATIGAVGADQALGRGPGPRSAGTSGWPGSRITFAYAAAGAVVLTAAVRGPAPDVSREVEQTQQVAARAGGRSRRTCFGAAARDPQAKDCPNPELEDTMVPTPAGAEDDWPNVHPRATLRCSADPLAPVHASATAGPAYPTSRWSATRTRAC